MTEQPQFIVGEVSKAWINGREAAPGSGLISENFERIIGFNLQRGYVLHSFALHRIAE